VAFPLDANPDTNGNRNADGAAHENHHADADTDAPAGAYPDVWPPGDEHSSVQ
jgi:hypothetical protein